MILFRYTRWGAIAVGLCTAACAAQGELSLSANERTELATLKAQLTDPARSAQTKREAALLLLTRTYPQAAAALRDFLSDDSNRPAQAAIAETIAQSGNTHLDYLKPLHAMLNGSEPSLRLAAANALASFKDSSVLEGFIKTLRDPKTEREKRLVIVQAMSRILDKSCVDALVGLLDDADEAVRTAAADSLANLTSIRAFGRSADRWKSWWAGNRDKPRTAWLTDLADNLARANQELDRENAELRKRLVAAMGEMYAAAPPPGKDALLAEMLKDALPEIRLAAARLTQQRLTNSQPLPEALKAQIRSAIGDADAAVRGAAAVLLAGLDDPQTPKLLMDRLEKDQAPECREGIYQALGLLKDVDAWDALLAGVAETDRRAAAAAAASLGKLAAKGAAEERRAAAAEALRKRYLAISDAESPSLREALLGTMATLKDKRLADVMTTALKDPSAAIRLSAVRGLQTLAVPESVAAVAARLADADRGVRLAAISATGALGGLEQVDTILARTDPQTETDAAVRDQAWSVVMSLLAKADPPRLASFAERLSQRPEAADYLISVLKLWADKLPEDKVEQWTPVRQQLGAALVAASRPAEGAGELAKVHAALAKANSPKAGDIYLKLIEALLSADDTTAAAKIADTQDPALFSAALACYRKRLEALKEKKDWNALVSLCGAGAGKLDGRLDAEQHKWLSALLNEAKAQQKQADEQRVSALVVRLIGPDEAARQAAAKDFSAMNQRAVLPLVGELRNLIKTEGFDPAAEKAILDVLVSLWPQLKGYDPALPVAERLKTIDGWLKQLGA